ncbi:CDP-alcohol phosphatidyltransferase family protein [Micromonospora sp. CPCC 205539]|uniref:CDP-alcohol phosphatidyltransferase family protein n=1 Tax=Micromonospora sp. CPCC 205539 TaxID=3122408 RepID=UPI002FF36412
MTALHAPPTAPVHGWAFGTDGPVRTIPNVITAVRLIACVALAIPAILSGSTMFTLASIAVYWIGDILDGEAARRLRQETRRGAVFDIVADRISSTVVIAALVQLRPTMAVPLALFLIQFDILDCALSLSFLRWPLLSINYFHLVHRGVYRWNWSPPAKAANTAGLVLLVAFGPSPVYATVFVVAVIAMKVVSLWAVCRIPRWSGPARPADVD